MVGLTPDFIRDDLSGFQRQVKSRHTGEMVLNFVPEDHSWKIQRNSWSKPKLGLFRT